LKQKNLPVLDITGFFFRMSTQVKAEVRSKFFCFNNNVVVQNFILNTVFDWFNDKELTNGSFWYNLRGKRLWKGPK
jgi:hypothetical protein